LIAREADRHDGLVEWAGALYGPPVRSWNPTLFAAAANELAQDKKFGSCRLSQATIEAWERSGARHAANNALIIGSFHSQPGANTKPSRKDLERWREMLDRSSHDARCVSRCI
jgi:hypothetical protein